MNQAARDYSSPLLESPWRNFDEQHVKWNYEDEEVQAMYRYTQENSRLLKDKGSTLVRADIEEIRRAAGEKAWSDIESGTAEPVPAEA
jgi:hypothetical protein